MIPRCTLGWVESVAGARARARASLCLREAAWLSRAARLAKDFLQASQRDASPDSAWTRAEREGVKGRKGGKAAGETGALVCCWARSLAWNKSRPMGGSSARRRLRL